MYQFYMAKETITSYLVFDQSWEILYRAMLIKKPGIEEKQSLEIYRSDGCYQKCFSKELTRKMRRSTSMKPSIQQNKYMRLSSNEAVLSPTVIAEMIDQWQETE